MLKGVDFENVEEDLANKSEVLLKDNPVHKKVPVLVHNGWLICESMVILEYIEETWKENAILPKDLYGKAMAHFYCNFGDDKVFHNLCFLCTVGHMVYFVFA